jgi:hypothetical protein
VARPLHVLRTQPRRHQVAITRARLQIACKACKGQGIFSDSAKKEVRRIFSPISETEGAPCCAPRVMAAPARRCDPPAAGSDDGSQSKRQRLATPPVSVAPPAVFPTLQLESEAESDEAVTPALANAAVKGENSPTRSETPEAPTQSTLRVNDGVLGLLDLLKSPGHASTEGQRDRGQDRSAEAAAAAAAADAAADDAADAADAADATAAATTPETEPQTVPAPVYRAPEPQVRPPGFPRRHYKPGPQRVPQDQWTLTAASGSSGSGATAQRPLPGAADATASQKTRPSATAPRPFVCRFEGCNYAATHRRYLQEHECVHTGARPFACTWEGCNYRSSGSGHMARHVRIHMGDRPYKCTEPGCDYSASQSGHLRTHMRKHTGERPFACAVPGCSYAASRRGHLRRHMKVHGGGKLESPDS